MIEQPSTSPPHRAQGPAEPETEALRIFTEVGIIHQLATARLERVLPPGMTPAQFALLTHFVRREPGWQTPSSLAAAFQVRRATMTSTLKRLAAKGLVSITADPEDGRGKRVAITPQGRAMRAACVEALGPTFDNLHRQVSAELFAQLVAPLTQLRQVLDENRDD